MVTKRNYLFIFTVLWTEHTADSSCLVYCGVPPCVIIVY